MIRIICIGNRFAYPDNFGILIYEALKEKDLDGVEIIEGGVGGDSLALYFDDDVKIIIVDYATDDMPKIMTQDDIKEFDIDEYNHANSLLYFLKTTQKDYTLYLCRDKFDEANLEAYIEDIFSLTKGIS